MKSKPRDIDENELMLLRSSLLTWGRVNFRDYSWRNTQNPYKILISEVMLHRTQSEQVVPVYSKFIKRYPDVQSLVMASEEAIIEIMKPLGLMWRINLVHPMALFIIEHFQGEIPQGKDYLKKIPGVSDYIASAVRCFSWNEHEAIADTNTIRITGRIFGLTIRDSSRRNRMFIDLLSMLIPSKRPRDFNYALLDLGSIICTKRIDPQCGKCPIQKFCKFGMNII